MEPVARMPDEDLLHSEVAIMSGRSKVTQDGGFVKGGEEGGGRSLHGCTLCNSTFLKPRKHNNTLAQA